MSQNEGVCIFIFKRGHEGEDLVKIKEDVAIENKDGEFCICFVNGVFESSACAKLFMFWDDLDLPAFFFDKVLEGLESLSISSCEDDL